MLAYPSPNKHGRLGGDREWLDGNQSQGMNYPVTDKLEIIGPVEESHPSRKLLPARSLEMMTDKFVGRYNHRPYHGLKNSFNPEKTSRPQACTLDVQKRLYSSERKSKGGRLKRAIAACQVRCLNWNRG